jgi:hypothetical protein
LPEFVVALPAALPSRREFLPSNIGTTPRIPMDIEPQPKPALPLLALLALASALGIAVAIALAAVAMLLAAPAYADERQLLLERLPPAAASR